MILSNQNVGHAAFGQNIFNFTFVTLKLHRSCEVKVFYKNVYKQGSIDCLHMHPLPKESRLDAAGELEMTPSRSTRVNDSCKFFVRFRVSTSVLEITEFQIAFHRT